MRKKIIIDCDPGVDDALALALASWSKQFDLLAVTTVFGNREVDTTTKNAEFILQQLLEKKTLVAKGSAKPLENIQRPAELFHGENGLRDISLDYPQPYRLEESAEELIIQLIKKYPHEITLVALGPLTNLAKVILAAPELVKQIKQIVLMGGSAFTRGNTTAKAEANFYHDPKAASIVVNCGVKIYLVGLDVTLATRIYPQDIQPRLQDNNEWQQRLLKKIFATDTNHKLEEKGTAFHDPLTIAYLIDASILTFEPYYLAVETMIGALCEGACVVDQRSNAPAANIMVATKVDQDKYKKILLDTIFTKKLAE